MNLPIRVRLTLWYAGVLALMIVVLGSFLVLQLKSDLRQEIDDEALASSRAIARSYTEDLRDVDSAAPADPTDLVDDFVDSAASSVPSGSVQLMDAAGRVTASYGAAGAAPMVGPAVHAAAVEGRSTVGHTRLGEKRQSYRVLTTPLRHGADRMVLVIALSQQRADDAVRQVFVLLLLGGSAALAATTPVAYWLARKALRPVEQMTRDAQAIGAGDLTERIAVPASDDEVMALAVTLNDMLARIQWGVVNKHRLIADASHELRTPLAVMRAELDVSLRGDDLPESAREVLDSAREEVDRMNRAIDNLLALEAVEEGALALLTEPVDLRVTCEIAAHPMRLLAEAKGISLAVEGPTCLVEADAQRLGLALTNLIENAIKFGSAGSSVRVTSWLHDAEVGVTVADDGPGIAAGHEDHLFDRYYRAQGVDGPQHGGNGLGLAICREVARAHDGRIWVESAPGGGSAFSLALPSWRVLPDESGAGTVRQIDDLTPTER